MKVDTQRRSCIVQKFGGTSLGSIDLINRVADRIVSMKRNYVGFLDLLVVVSAMGKTTDDLINMLYSVNPNPDDREYDAVVSTGEVISASLLASALKRRGCSAVSLTGSQAGILTESLHRRARIAEIDTRRIHQEFALNKVVVLTGFQGVNDKNDVTTIGRGGSDTSAVAVAGFLGAEYCEIFTDVDGIYTANPRVVLNAKKLDTISYDEMLELASLGAQVLHSRSVEYAKNHDIVLSVRSSFSFEEGTFVKELSDMETSKRVVTGIAVNKEESLISIIDIPDSPGTVGKIFSEIAKNAINVDLIIQSVENANQNSVSFSVHVDDLKDAEVISKKVAANFLNAKVIHDGAIAKVSIVGVGMMSQPGVAAKMFTVLGDAGINIKRISTSEIKISCAIDRRDADKAQQLLHEAFGLSVA